MNDTWYEAGLAYMKVEEADDVAVAIDMLDAAVAYMTNLGVPTDLAGKDKLYDMTVRSLALHYYDHRDSVGNEAAFPMGIRPIITQYKLAYGT